MNDRIMQMVTALRLARPHVERIAATQPTTPSRDQRRKDAVIALRAIDAALGDSTSPTPSTGR